MKNEWYHKNKSLEEFGLLIKGCSKATKNEAKEQKGGFLGMLLGTLGASLIGNLLTGKIAIAMSQGCVWSETLSTQPNMSGQGIIRAGKAQLECIRIFNAASLFNKFSNTKLLSKRS